MRIDFIVLISPIFRVLRVSFTNEKEKINENMAQRKNRKSGTVYRQKKRTRLFCELDRKDKKGTLQKHGNPFQEKDGENRQNNVKPFIAKYYVNRSGLVGTLVKKAV